MTSPTKWKRSCANAAWCWSGATPSRADAGATGSTPCCGAWPTQASWSARIPDTILQLGTKDVLVDTRDLPFGSDVLRVDSLAQLERELPARLAKGARVLKQYRGHSGIGVWRVEAAEPRRTCACATPSVAAPKS